LQVTVEKELVGASAEDDINLKKLKYMDIPLLILLFRCALPAGDELCRPHVLAADTGAMKNTWRIWPQASLRIFLRASHHSKMTATRTWISSKKAVLQRGWLCR
jgi:hypothetical protein